jgi:hypothetical protein
LLNISVLKYTLKKYFINIIVADILRGIGCKEAIEYLNSSDYLSLSSLNELSRWGKNT